jgi:ABC-type glycerol-3-phosphate transport system substrate-binding protein
MKVFKNVFALLLMVALSSTLFAQGSAEPQTKGPVTLEVWARGDEIKQFVPGFEAENPDIKVNVTVIPDAEMTPKLITVLASGKGVPDLFMQEANYITYLLEAGCFADLNEAPYHIDDYRDNIWKATLDVGTDSSGIVRVLTWQTNPGAIIYRRDIAKKYFGTDDPATVSTFLDSDEKMLSVAARMKKDGIRFVSCFKDIYDSKIAQRTDPWVVNGKLVIDPVLLDFMDMAKTIIENGYDLGVDQWASEWIAAVESDDLFCYILPPWGYQYVVKPAAKKTVGQWAITTPATAYISGGSYLGIYDKTPHKDAAWKFFSYVLLNEDSQYAYAKKSGDFMVLKSVCDKLAAGEGEKVLGGQNPNGIFIKEMQNNFRKLNTVYDSQLNDAFISAIKAYAAGLSKDDAIAKFRQDVKTAFPDISVN